MALMSDNLGVVGELAIEGAKAFPDKVHLRILCATGNESYQEAIRRLATTSVPANVKTLWIRESMMACGTFHPPRPGLSLIEQLLDSAPFNPSSMLDAHRAFAGVGNSDVLGDSPPCTKREGKSSQCSQCKKVLARGKFSSTQWKKNQSRCKKCVT